MFQELRASLVLLVLFSLLTGIAYPLALNGLGGILFPHQAGGSLVVRNGTIVGSALIGQSFTSDIYFHSRPSAAGNGYDASNSSGSNLAPTSPDLITTITARVSDLRKDGDSRAIPVDMVTTSGSGLDPDISVAAAAYQASRVAAARNVPVPQIQELIARNTTPRTLGILGETRVNVLALNRALDLAAPAPASTPTPAASTTPSPPDDPASMAPDATPAPTAQPADSTPPAPRPAP
jgi:K+-transporting ATPase ATPase C chain